MKKKPQRMCVSCREMKDKIALFRLRVNGDKVEYDSTGKLPGRGAYICKSVICIERAKRKKIIESALSATCSLELFEELESYVD
ncbi:MAG: YlxR family protein [Clostridia bacterium]|nr:YlxR family protein [Clostridia bacterium]MBP5649386.1 YlxR family protein [Clostridia bacterium]